MAAKAAMVLKPGAFTFIPEAAALSQADLAATLGVTRQTLARALDGETVSAGFVAAVTLAFGRPIEQMFKAVRLAAA